MLLKATVRTGVGLWSSMGMASGEPVPRAIGEMLSDWSAEKVQASISIIELVPGVAGGLACAVEPLLEAMPDGGGTAL